MWVSWKECESSISMAMSFLSLSRHPFLGCVVPYVFQVWMQGIDYVTSFRVNKESVSLCLSLGTWQAAECAWYSLTKITLCFPRPPDTSSGLSLVFYCLPCFLKWWTSCFVRYIFSSPQLLITQVVCSKLDTKSCANKKRHMFLWEKHFLFWED